MKRQSILMFLITAIMAPSVLAQQKTIGEYIIGAFDWTGGFFNEVTAQGYESTRFLMFVRLILVVVVITLFYTILHKYIFKESKDKNKNIVLSVALGLLTTIAMPKEAISGIAQLYSGALMLVLFGGIILGGFYAIFWGIKGENKGTYVLKAMMSLGVVFLTSMTISIFEKAPGAIRSFDWLLVIVMLIAIGGVIVFALKIVGSPGSNLGGSRFTIPATPPSSGGASTPSPAPQTPSKPKVIPDISHAQKALKELSADAVAVQGATDFNSLIQSLRAVEAKAGELRNEVIVVQNNVTMPEFSQVDAELGTIIAGARELSAIASREQLKPKPPSFKQFRVQITRGRILGGGSVGNAIEDLNSRCIALNALLIKMLNGTQR